MLMHHMEEGHVLEMGKQQEKRRLHPWWFYGVSVPASDHLSLYKRGHLAEVAIIEPLSQAATSLS